MLFIFLLADKHRQAFTPTFDIAVLQIVSIFVCCLMSLVISLTGFLHYECHTHENLTNLHSGLTKYLLWMPKESDNIGKGISLNALLHSWIFRHTLISVSVILMLLVIAAGDGE